MMTLLQQNNGRQRNDDDDGKGKSAAAAVAAARAAAHFWHLKKWMLPIVVLLFGVVIALCYTKDLHCNFKQI